MSTNPVRRQLTTVNPMFFIPDGVDELTYDQVNPGIDESSDAEVVDADEVSDNFNDVAADYELPIPAVSVPDILSVVSQTLRRGDGGIDVIDVIIEVSDTGDGVQKYEFRITKT